MRNGMRGHADANLHLLQCLLVAHHDPWMHRRRSAVQPVLAGLQRLEALSHQLHKSFVIEAARSRNNQITGMNVPGVVAEQ